MARRTKIVTIDAAGRDHGKVFALTELPASQAERWAIRALLALGRSGVDVPPNIASAGMAGIAAMGIRALFGLQFYEAEPLLDEMFSCVQIAPDPKKPKVIRALIEDDIEEVSTRAFLRSEVFELHTGFSLAGLLSIWALPAAVADEITQITPTSPEV